MPAPAAVASATQSAGVVRRVMPAGAAAGRWEDLA